MNSLFKPIVNSLMQILSWPVYATYCVMRRIVPRRKAFAAVMQSVSLLPGITGEWFRRGVLQWISKSSLENCCIGFGVLFSDPDLEIETGVYIGPRSDIGRVKIARDVILGSGVHITSGRKQHGISDLDIPIRDQNGVFTPVSVGKGSWIGNGAIIMANIGHGCIIGSGSVVVSPIPDNAIAVGNPAQVIKFREGETQTS